MLSSWEEQKPRNPWDPPRALCATGLEPIAIYTVSEITVLKRRNKSYTRYRADVLTEVGRYNFDHRFHTEQGAKRFCERHFRDWQKKQAAR
jgi:hypothetical protein